MSRGHTDPQGGVKEVHAYLERRDFTTCCLWRQLGVLLQSICQGLFGPDGDWKAKSKYANTKTPQETDALLLKMSQEAEGKEGDVHILVASLAGTPLLQGWCFGSASVRELKRSVVLASGRATAQSVLLMNGEILADHLTIQDISAGSKEISMVGMFKEGAYCIDLDRSGKALQLWDVKKNIVQLALVGHVNGILDVHADWEHDRVLTTSSDATVRLWKLGNGECLMKATLSGKPITSSISWPQQRVLVIASMYMSYAVGSVASMWVWDFEEDYVVRSPTDYNRFLQFDGKVQNWMIDVNWDSMHVFLLANDPSKELKLIDFNSATVLQTWQVGEVGDIIDKYQYATSPFCSMFSFDEATQRAFVSLRDAWHNDQARQASYVPILVNLTKGVQQRLHEARPLHLDWTSNRLLLVSEGCFRGRYEVYDLIESKVIMQSSAYQKFYWPRVGQASKIAARYRDEQVDAPEVVVHWSSNRFMVAFGKYVQIWDIPDEVGGDEIVSMNGSACRVVASLNLVKQIGPIMAGPIRAVSHSDVWTELEEATLAERLRRNGKH